MDSTLLWLRPWRQPLLQIREGLNKIVENSTKGLTLPPPPRSGKKSLLAKIDSTRCEMDSVLYRSENSWQTASIVISLPKVEQAGAGLSQTQP